MNLFTARLTGKMLSAEQFEQNIHDMQERVKRWRAIEKSQELAEYKALKAIGKNVYICRCGIDKNQHCTNCTACSKNDFVLFIEHSTEYKAEKDPLFPVVKELIENQADPAERIAA